MNTDEKILKAIEELKQGQTALQADVKGIKTDVKDVKADVSGIKADTSEIKTEQLELERGQIKLEIGQEAIKGMITLLNSNFVKTAHSHGERIKNLEERTGTENPLKH